MCEQQVLYRHNKGVLKTPEIQIQLLDDQVIVRLYSVMTANDYVLHGCFVCRITILILSFSNYLS